MPEPRVPGGQKEVVFEAALAPVGHCFALSADGDARFVLTVPASAVAPLSLAFAEGRLQERTFIVRIEL